MESLVAVFVATRRGLRGATPMLTAMVLAAIVAVHAASPLDQRLFALFIIVVLALVAVRAWQRTAAVEHRRWREVELGVLLAVAAYATTIHVDGSLDGRYYPIVYVAIGVMSSFARPASLLTVIGLMVAFEIGLRQLVHGVVDVDRLLPHIGFAMVFGLLNTLSLRMEVARLRKASRNELKAERERMLELARSYRLLRAPREDQEDDAERIDDEERLIRSGVDAAQMAVLYALRLLRESLSVHTAMLLWLDAGGDTLRISELVSDDQDLHEGPFSARDGVLGVVLTQRETVCLANLKPSYVLPYYRGACPVKAACVAPVFQQGALRGVLVADRADAEPFDREQQRLVEQAARFAARAVENERVFVQLERTKVEQGRLYRAAGRLGAAITEQEVVDAGVNSAREIAAVDFVAFTAYDEADDNHEIDAVSGDDAEQLIGRRFASNTGLVSMALRMRHPLPYRGEYNPSHQVLFDRRQGPPDMPALVVLPLIVHEQPLGTLVLGSREPGAFNDATRNLLEVLASHLAVSLSNARMVRRLEEQATTDGLTGLLNKRAMLETAEDKLRAAKRFGRQLSVLIADIDHFKRVNDTYGHDVGDIAIKELAQIHQRNKRTTDSVARFGGEEFVTICDETDAEGALLLAERIRAEFGRTTFHAAGETVYCTCSVGIATFPTAGDSWQELFKAADSALYTSKRSGRDRATIFDARRDSHAA